MISPIGIIYLLLIVAIIKQKDSFFNLFMLCLITEVFIRMGSVCPIGSTYLPYDMFTEIILVTYCLINLRQISPRYLNSWILLMMSYFIPILLLAIFPSSELVATPKMTWDEIMFGGGQPIHPTVTFTVIQVTLRWSLFSLVYLYVYEQWKVKDYERALLKFSKISQIFIILGIVEFIAKVLLGMSEQWGEMLQFLFGEYKDTVFVARLRGNIIELNLFEQESSHYAYILMFVCLLRFASNIIQNKKMFDVYVWGILFLMLSSSSLSAIYLIFIILVVFFARRWFVQKVKSSKYEIFSMLFCIVAVLSFTTVLLSVDVDWFVAKRLFVMLENFDIIFSSEAINSHLISDNSTLIRMASMIQTLMAFLKRPIFGYSLFSIHGHSTTAMFLAGVGIFGLYNWIIFYFLKNPLYKLLSPSRFLYYFGILLLLFVNLLGGDMRMHYGLMLLMMAVAYCYLFNANIKRNLLIAKFLYLWTKNYR